MKNFSVPFIRRYQDCPRCTKQFPKSLSSCPHCADVGDAGLNVLEREHERELDANAVFGRWLLLGAGLLALALLLSWL